jgi:hypothetical protein
MGVLRAFRRREEVADNQLYRHPSLIVNEITENFSPTSIRLREAAGNFIKDKTVLDLGSAIGNNVSCYSSFACRIYIEELFSTILKLREEGKKLSHLSADEIFPYSEETMLDFVLCWDVINYIDHEELKAFFEALSPHCHENTIVSLIIFTGKNISPFPSTYKIVPDEGLECIRSEKNSQNIPNFRYNKSKIKQQLSDFTRKRSLLLRNGMEEILLMKAQK